MANIREIARKTNVSIATVSRALNNHPEIKAETRQKVLKAANEEGYFATTGRNSTNALGLVFTGDIYWSAYDSAVLSGVIRGVAEEKLDVTLINLLRDKDPGETFTQFFTRKRLRGVIVRTTSEYRSLCQQIAGEGFPMIVVAERFEGTNVNFIGYDSRDDSRRAVEHLLHLGHRRIALCVQMYRDRDHQDRMDGYRDALAAAGIAYDEELVIQGIPAISISGSGASAIKRLMSLPRPPTAVYITDPPTAVDAVRRAQEMNIKIPDDLSIIGFDDEDMRHQVYPTLTAVCQSAFNEGFEAALWLSHRLNGNGPATCQKVFNTFFEVNQTTGIMPRNPIRILPDGSRLPVDEQA